MMKEDVVVMDDEGTDVVVMDEEGTAVAAV